MDGREQRGQAIAAKGDIRQSGDSWLVPSASLEKKVYVVRPNPEKLYCSCPDFESLGGTPTFRCKHLVAVEIVRQQSLFPDGSERVTETVTVRATVERKSYPQQWREYNASQCAEKSEFQALLADLCSGLKDPPQGMGRKRMPLADAVFAATYKTYSTLSARRFMTDMRDAHERGFLSRPVSYSSIFKAMENPDLKDILRELIYQSALPLRTVEERFAVDSTGFSTSRYTSWFSEKHGKEKTGRVFVKLHACCGVKTNIITAAEVTDQNEHDGPQLPELVEVTAQNFKIAELSGDKAYSSVTNLQTIDYHGGTALIPFKSNATGAAGGLWSRAYHYFAYHQDEFLARYHARSNIESTFSMIKRKFGDFIRSRTDAAMKNETLCKVLAHNICVLIHETRELGIQPAFYGNAPKAESPTILRFPAPTMSTPRL